MTDYQSLRPYASPRQLEMLDAMRREGSVRKAAKALGITDRPVFAALERLRENAARKGWAPDHDMTHTAAPGFTVSGLSTLYNAEGQMLAQWVKTKQGAENAQAALREAAEALAESMPRLKPLRAPTHAIDALATVYTLTDAHVGALAWHEETGADWDLKIAEQTLLGCYESLLSSSPNSGLGVVAQLGDWMHWDSAVGGGATTPTSGHALDADGRYTKVVRVAVKILRRMVDLALMKHDRVLILMAEGNHDLSSSVWLRTLFSALYENEPRAKVIDSPLPYYAHQHGKTMLAWHHGHLRKTDQLPLLFAAQFPQVWGGTTHRYAHTGHFHHVEEKEHSGMTVIQHPTLAARDAYAARGGWIAIRNASAITYHREYGQVGRVTTSPEMAMAA